MSHRLTGVPIFAGLNDEALNLFLAQAAHLVAQPGEVVAREREVSNSMFIIASGAVRIVKSLGQPGETELARLGPKDFFGEMCILETLPRSASAQAVEKTEIYRISSMAFLHLYEKMPAQYGILLLNMARDLSRRLRHLDEAFAARH